MDGRSSTMPSPPKTYTSYSLTVKVLFSNLVCEFYILSHYLFGIGLKSQCVKKYGQCREFTIFHFPDFRNITVDAFATRKYVIIITNYACFIAFYYHFFYPHV